MAGEGIISWRSTSACWAFCRTGLNMESRVIISGGRAMPVPTSPRTLSADQRGGEPAGRYLVFIEVGARF